MMTQQQVFLAKKKKQEEIKRFLPNILDMSGIYIFHRISEEGFKYFYAGQAKNLVQRISAHWFEYDRIAFSLKKRGLKTEENPHGWDISYFYCSLAELDARETQTISSWHIAHGYIPYNVTSGGQGANKTDINERKPTKGYRDGLEQGQLNARRFVAKLFEKNLVYGINGKPNKNKEKALKKFEEFIEMEKEENGTDS